MQKTLIQLCCLLTLVGATAQAGPFVLSYDSAGNLIVREAGVDSLPEIIRQPKRQIARPGSLASFSVLTADPRGESYQWRLGAGEMLGETRDTLLLLNVSPAQAGLYSVVVSNFSGSLTSAPAALWIDTDGDGLPEAWELTHFGNLTSRRGAGDADGDRISNRDEFEDGTDTIGARHGAFYDGASAVGPSATASGKFGGAFAFSGGLHVRIPDAPDLRPARFTAEAWVFPTVQNASFQTIVSSGSSVNDVNAWFVGLENGRVEFFSNHGSMQQLEVPAAIPLNQWTHVAISFDGTGKRIYVNGGQAIASVGYTAIQYNSGSVPLTIGSDWVAGASAQRFTGRIGDLNSDKTDCFA